MPQWPVAVVIAIVHTLITFYLWFFVLIAANYGNGIVLEMLAENDVIVKYRYFIRYLKTMTRQVPIVFLNQVHNSLYLLNCSSLLYCLFIYFLI